MTLEILESRHTEYENILPTWEKIYDLSVGGHQIEKKNEKYLPKRAGEEEEIYRTRISKFTYRNLLGTGVQQQASKLTSGSYFISGLEAHQEFWSEFRENVNLKGQSEKELLGRIFRQALLFGKTFIHIDKPLSSIRPKNKAQERMLGLRPYITLYSALDVTDWEENQGKLSFVKVRQSSKFRLNPFSPNLDKVTWTYITPEAVIKYSALVKLDAKGRIVSLLNESGEEIEIVSSETEIPLENAIAHGLDKLPVLKFELPIDLWACNQAYLLALEHLNLRNILYDGASLATYIQRVYKPYRVPDGDFENTYTEESSEEEVLSGNPYILRAESFKFEEMSGSALNTLKQIIEQIEVEVRESISLGVASTSKEALQRSGISKQLDLYREELVLRAYGQLLVDFYQDVLQLAAKSAGLNSPEQISVNGLNSFELQNTETLVLTAKDLLELKSLLPPTVIRLFSKHLSSSLIPNASAEEQALIQEEIETLNLLDLEAA